MNWNLANKITLVRVFMIPLFLVVLLGGFFSEEASRIVATAIFVIASATDALDGYIARSRNMITNLGKFMDPLADKLLVAAALIALVGLGDLPSWVVILILSREFIVTGFRTVAASRGIIIAAGGSAKIKTAVQMIMLTYALLDMQSQQGAFWIIYIVLIILAVFLTVFSGIEYIYKNIGVLSEN